MASKIIWQTEGYTIQNHPLPPRANGIGFDVEKVLVLTQDEERYKNVRLYDFTV